MIISFTKKISSAALVLCCSSLDFFVLQTFFETMPREAKEEISRSDTSSTSTSVLDSHCGSLGIASVLMQFRATSTCYILTFSFIGGTSDLSSSTILLSLKICDPRSLRSGAKNNVQR